MSNNAAIIQTGNITGQLNKPLTIKAILSLDRNTPSVSGMKIDGQIKGSVQLYGVISGSLNAVQDIHGALTVSSNLDYYRDTYIVVPTNHEQILHTKSKVMLDDVNVKKIPYYETSNKVGTTVYIGGN